jgi:acyl-CoA synthetase (AMP-forming)/AMP-acid ligase II
MTDLAQAPSAVAVIRAHAASRPLAEAVVFVDDVERADRATRWTYARLDAEARRTGAWLSAHFTAGARVLLLYPTGPDFVAAYVGCLYAGMVAVPAPLPGRFRHERARVRHLARDAQVGATLTDGAHLADVTEWAEAEAPGAPVVATDGRGLPGDPGWTPGGWDHSTPAMLQYTSGTTGSPKGVVLRHGNLLHNAESQRRAFRLPAEARVGGWVPHFHDMGLLGQILPPLLYGGCCVLMRPGAFAKRPYHWLRLVDAWDLSMSAAPNFGYALCCARVTDEQLAGLDLSRWHVAVTGSEPLDPAVLDAFAARFAPAGLRAEALTPCYGMAEATVFVSGEAHRGVLRTRVDTGELRRGRLVPAAAGTDLVGCGRPDACDVLVVDPCTGRPRAPGGVGEVWVRGPGVTAGYWREDTAGRRAFAPGGYLRTGDLGALHEGELYVTGRLAEAVTVGGRTLYPQDIERELRAHHPELAGGGAVFTVPPGGNDDGSPALVVTHEVAGRPAESVLRPLAAGMARTVAREFHVDVDGVLLLRRGGVRRTTSGKIQRAAMRRLFRSGELAPLYAACPPQPAQPLCTALTPAPADVAG